MYPASFSLIIRSLFLLFVGLGLAACGGGGGSSPTATAGTNPSVAARTSVIAPGDATCPNGGVLVKTGIDENSNGVLDANEVDASEKVCNGAPGATGGNGSNGLNALVNISTEAAGANCANGGKRIDSGLDADGNGSLSSAEIARTDYVCDGVPGVNGSNGTNGTNGIDGSNGTNGLNALVDMNPEPVGVNCPNGGMRIDVGIDTNNNGSLDPAKITQTGFVCSGTDGSLGWQVATLIETDNVGTAIEPQVSVDASGNAVAVWTQFDGTNNNIWANRYVVGTGWGTAQLIETDNAESMGSE